MNQIIHHLKNSNRILLASHANPDGDAIGSLIAMGLSLDVLNKKTTLYNESPVPAVYNFLPAVERIVQHIDRKNVYDTAIIFDCSDLQRIGKDVSIVSRIPVIINIDHHATNTHFGDFQLIDTSACATTEIIYRLLKKMAVRINKAIATSIYTGILTDTGSFRFSNTNRSVFAICEEMSGLGVDPHSVARHIYETYSLGRIKLLGMVLSSIEISCNNKLSIMILTKKMLNETNTQPEDINGFVNYAKGIEGIKIAVLIKELASNNEEPEKPGRFNVSLRSDETVDVAAIAASFGGGGHSVAAGFSIESTLSDIKSKIINLAENCLGI